jgi:phosphate acetyltransferase
MESNLKQCPVIAYTDATDPRVIKAAHEISVKKLAKPLLIGNLLEIQKACEQYNLPKIGEDLISKPFSADEKKKAAQLLSEKQKKFNIDFEKSLGQLNDPLYKGVSLLLDKKVDGLVGGSTRPTADIVKAALQCIGPKDGVRLISGHFLIETEDLKTQDQTPFLFADCAVVPEPSPRALAAIAIGAAASYKFFTGVEAKVALLSFSTRDSAVHPLVDRIKEAVKIARDQAPGLIIDGEIQADAALDPQIAVIKKIGDSPVAGGKANVFIFPTLEAGNIGYKLIQRFGKARIAGPLLWGLNKPMSDLSRGCSVQEIIDTTLCVSTLIQGQN